MAEKGKRLRSEDDDESTKPVDREELLGLFESFKNEISGITKAQTEKATESMGTQIGGTMQRLITKYDEGVQEKYGQLEKKISCLNERTGSLEKSNGELFQKCADLDKKIGEFARTLEIAETATPAPTQPPYNPNWDREADGTIIKVNANEVVPREDVIKALEGLLGEFKDRTIMSGSNSADSKAYTIKFTGPTGTAKQRVQKVLASQRRADGTWNEYSVKVRDPSDDSGDGRLKLVRLSIGEDKSSKQIATEIAGKKLRDILSEVYPAKQFYLSKADGKISSNWINIAMVVPQPDKSVTIDWQVNSPLYSSINVEDVAVRFRLANGSAAATQEVWQHQYSI